MITILIPTDFNPSAIDNIPNICDQYKNKEIKFLFVHMFKLSDSITDLLMLSRRSREHELISEEFYNRAAIVQQKFSQIKSIKVDFFYGSTLSIFKNYMEANEIDCILHPKYCSYSKINSASLDCSTFVEKCKIEIINIKHVSAEEPQKLNQERQRKELVDQF